jgi:V8-like Glu-specific endopeptidase
MKNLISIILLIASFTYCIGQNYPAYRTERVAINSGKHSVKERIVEMEENEDTTVFCYTINVPDAAWLRVIFSKYDLGDNSYLEIHSLIDGSSQFHTQKSLEDWRNQSDFFNGDELEIKLNAKRGCKDVFFSIDTIIIGEKNVAAYIEKDLCGADDRDSSSDVRIGRLTTPGQGLGWVGTVWLTSNGAILTAAHVVDWDPFGGDGESDLLDSAFIEFSVPASDANGDINPAEEEDQYKIDFDNIIIPNRWGRGYDWAILRCLPNSITGLLPHQAQGSFFRITNGNPEEEDTIRVTGYGSDETPNSANGTLQTATGPYNYDSIVGNRHYHTYFVDAVGGNSGSPVIWEENGFAIGIHSISNCDSGEDGNIGTSVEHGPLEAALQNFHGENTIYVDTISLSQSEDGTIFAPYNTFQEGLNATPSGGKLFLTTGTYSGNNGIYINQEVTILPPATGVSIINP